MAWAKRLHIKTTHGQCLKGAHQECMDPFATCAENPNTKRSTPLKAHPAKLAHREQKVLYREQRPKTNVSFAACPTAMPSALSMCKVALLRRGGLVSGHLAPNVLLNAPVEPRHLVTAMVNATTGQTPPGHARVTRITLVPRAATHAIATQAAATMAHLVMESARASLAPMVLPASRNAIATQAAATMAQPVMEIARASLAPMVLPAAKHAIATQAPAAMGHLVMESARASLAPMVLPAVACAIATQMEALAARGPLVMEHAPVTLCIHLAIPNVGYRARAFLLLWQPHLFSY
jgi:hypothetical protein